MFFKKISFFDPQTSQMTGKAVSQFAYGLLNDEPHKGNLRDLARRRFIKKASPKPVSHGPDCSGSKSMNLPRISAMFQNQTSSQIHLRG